MSRSRSLLSFAKGYGEFRHPLCGCPALQSGEASLLPCFGIKAPFSAEEKRGLVLKRLSHKITPMQFVTKYSY